VGLLSYPASQCKFEIRYAVSLVGFKRSGWTQKHFEIVIKIFEYALTTCEIGLIFSNGLDPHGVNVLYSFADANHRLPRSQECHDLMMNGAAISMVSKKQTKSAPSTTSAETTALFQCSTDVLSNIRRLYTRIIKALFEKTTEDRLEKHHVRWIWKCWLFIIALKITKSPLNT
jgi:hypothetical protein